MTENGGSDTRLHVTKDGSHSLYSERFRQFYHNPNGAVDESLHVFFQYSGLTKALENHHPVNVLEVGFGTGLNLLLLADLAQKLSSKSEIRFESVEAWPLAPEQARELNYGKFLQNADLAPELYRIFDELREEAVCHTETGNVQAVIHKCLFHDFRPEGKGFTHIFHDAFSPEVNAELWSPGVFEKIRSWSAPDAVLATYCAATSARAAMAKAGWLVARAPGALGKREMTAASPSPQPLQSLKRVNEMRLIKRWESGEFGGGGQG